MSQSISEPVVITGASGQVGRALVAELSRREVNCKALVRKPAGLKKCEQYCNWMTSPEAEEVLASAGSVVHLAGNLKPANGDYETANLKTTERVAKSISPINCRKLVFLSFHGASINSSNQYLASKAQAEQTLLEAEVPTTILRCSHIIGSPKQPGPTASSLIANSRGVVTVLGNGKQRWAAVALQDVISAIIASLINDHEGQIELQGPEVMQLDELITVLNCGRQVRRLHIPEPLARLLRFSGLPESLIEVMLSDCFSEPINTPAIMGFKPTSIRDQWTNAQAEQAG